MNAYLLKLTEYLARRILARAVARASDLMDEFDEEYEAQKSLPSIRLPEIEYKN